MPIVRTAKGTASQKNITSTVTLANVAIAGGASVIVGVGGNSISGVTWNGLSLTLEQAGRSGGDGIYALHNVTGATGDVVVTGAAGSVVAFWVIELTGLAASPLDKSAGVSSTGSSPSSGNTATTTQADEILIGHIYTVGPSGDAAGTWSNSFTNGQRVGTTGGITTTNATVSEGYREVSATGAYAAAKTGVTSRSYGACIVTYKAAAVQPNKSGMFFGAIGI